MRYKCVVMYDGSLFHGFQTQKKGGCNLRTVQEELENTFKIIAKKNITIYPAGRTDALVHAYGQVFHVDLDFEMKEWQLKNALNSRLPRDIYIKDVEIVSDDFHARFDALSKEYLYIIDLNEYNPLLDKYRYFYKHKLDIDKMIEASKVFVGEHDFKSFTKNHKIENTVRTIYSIDFSFEDNVLQIRFKGNGFLHNMVRIIVAMLIEVGSGKKDIEYLKEAMDAKNRKFAPKTAPASALYLVKIEY